ncbi:IS1595 family transposase [Rhizosphaericola mali]|uniref:IS1595 family transposase n=1 Tax=Rhizosphaericola mali TaxID=2545455 RepID=A0A5P2FXY7_9BACT|nr:IS1595 family transposase [Rhizosphaericola mali]QES88404.1 IS1595 family transposase [Rhizosphaericola mali]
MSKYTISNFMKDYPNEDACLDKVFSLRYEGCVCPKCNQVGTYKRTKHRRSYQCSKCGNQLYPTKDTIFEKTTTPLTYWFYAIYLYSTSKNGVSAKELERALDVCYKTALRMSHQIKKLMQDNSFDLLEGTIECDETFVGGKNKNRHKDKKVEKCQGRSFKDKTPVLGILERGGRVKCFVVDNTRKESIQPLINSNVKKNSTVFTDEWHGYNGLSSRYNHLFVDHGRGQYVDGNIYTNTLEGFWSHVKRTINGSYIHVSKKHLQKYIDEVSFRYMHKLYQGNLFNEILNRIA